MRQGALSGEGRQSQSLAEGDAGCGFCDGKAKGWVVGAGRESWDEVIRKGLFGYGKQLVMLLGQGIPHSGKSSTAGRTQFGKFK